MLLSKVLTEFIQSNGETDSQPLMTTLLYMTERTDPAKDDLMDLIKMKCKMRSGSLLGLHIHGAAIG
jgi:hypothetical protein